MSHKFIKDLSAYDTVDQVFQVVSKQQRIKRDGLPYLNLELRDKTGKIQAKMWDNLPKTDSIVEHGFVCVKGQIELYKSALQLVISSLASASPEDINQEFFISKTSKDIELLYEEFKGILSGVKDPFLAELIQQFLTDNDFVREFKTTTAAIERHHPYSGGLLEHTVNILNIASRISEYYKIINTDLLLTGIFLHDIGKIKEYEIKITPQMTDEGRLIGHTILGIVMLEEKIRNIKDFPSLYKSLLEHLIGSHHGQYDYGAPVLPMTPEALLLHYLDNLDARMGEYQLLSKDLPSGGWTEWSKSLDRKFYKA
ncbi:MAG: HD domain-containing protein [Planctomycetota bacterium]